jgi:dihydrodipicolinate synthase/N-acetylneuraminate lyase
MKRQNLKGIVPVMITPLNDNFKPDQSAIEKLIELFLNAKVGGIWALGSASEDINLSFKSKIETAKLISKANCGNLPLIMGSGLTAIEDILSFFDKIYTQKIDGVQLLPYDTKMGDSRLIHMIFYLAERLPFPIWLYHNPKRGKPFTQSIVSEVKNHPNVAGMKIGGYNLSELTWALMLKDDDFDVIGAGSAQLYSMLSLGASAHTTSEASVFPEEFVKVYDHFMNGNLDVAKKIQFDLIRLSKSFPRNDNGEYCAEEKFMLSIRGICKEIVNPLYKQLTNNEKNLIRNALKNYGFQWAK